MPYYLGSVKALEVVFDTKNTLQERFLSEEKSMCYLHLCLRERTSGNGYRPLCSIRTFLGPLTDAVSGPPLEEAQDRDHTWLRIS